MKSLLISIKNLMIVNYYEEKLLALETAIRTKYGQGEKMWQKLFKDNL